MIASTSSSRGGSKLFSKFRTTFSAPGPARAAEPWPGSQVDESLGGRSPQRHEARSPDREGDRAMEHLLQGLELQPDLGLDETRIRTLTADIIAEARDAGDEQRIKDLFLLAFHTRWCRGGKGERKLFYQLLAGADDGTDSERRRHSVYIDGQDIVAARRGRIEPGFYARAPDPRRSLPRTLPYSAQVA